MPFWGGCSTQVTNICAKHACAKHALPPFDHALSSVLLSFDIDNRAVTDLLLMVFDHAYICALYVCGFLCTYVHKVRGFGVHMYICCKN